MWRCMLVAAMVWFAATATAQTVILGDSVAHGAGDESGRGIAGNLRALIPGPVINLGINGARTWNVLANLRGETTRLALRSSSGVVLSVGGNDLFGSTPERLFSALIPGVTMRLVIARLESIVARVHSLNPRARVYILGLYDPYRRTAIGSWIDRQVAIWDAALIRRFAGDRTVDVVRIADLIAVAGRISPLDHFHPSAAGYAAIAQRIAAAW